MRIPVSTYRLQFNSAFTFQDARALMPYLADLGITDIYASPIFRAVPGSMHGYDVCDPADLNPELGTEADLDAVFAETRRLGLGWVQDIVPNHMAYHPCNQLLMDVLENGRASPHARFFDIHWNLPWDGGEVLAPFLGRLYAEALENGEIELRYDRDGLCVRYGSLRLPLRAESYAKVMHPVNIPAVAGGAADPHIEKLLGVIVAFEQLEAIPHAHRPAALAAAKQNLWQVYSADPIVKDLVDETVGSFNGQKGDAKSFDRLEEVLDEQFYRLNFWKVAAEEINYRRFFNISQLICVRAEDDDVFEHTHSLVFKYVEGGEFTGLRVDHVDGLYDPAHYLHRLRKRTDDIYIIVEKILGWDEPLPAAWRTQGTTGYDFAVHLNAVFSMRENESVFNRIYSRFSPSRQPYREMLYSKKRLIAERIMAGEVDTLAFLLKRVALKHRFGKDMTVQGLKRVLLEVLAAFPVYRSYLGSAASSELDRAAVNEAIRSVTRYRPDLLYELNFLQQVLLLEYEAYSTDEDRRDWLNFVRRFQQFTGPLMAKGFEDTFLYVYNRLLPLNEVGGDPSVFGTSPEQFHQFNAHRSEQYPHALNATATHDTKRGEDARARLNVLSELPDEWSAAVLAWRQSNRRKKRLVAGSAAPDGNDRYQLYQSLLGAWPFDAGEREGLAARAKGFMLKAIREAKVHTEWHQPDAQYEDACLAFVERILEQSPRNQFLKQFEAFQGKIAWYGMLNSLSQVLLKITSPGVPDFYRGSEFWDLSFVDPDNRRTVDFERRKAALREIIEKAGQDLPALIAELLASRQDGRVKLFLIWKALAARKQRAALFQKGSYLPLRPQGELQRHVIAFARSLDRSWMLAIAPRFITAVAEEGRDPLGEVWRDTAVPLPEARLRLGRM